MQTLRQIVSTLASDVKALNLDDRISFRYLASKFNAKIQYFLRLEARSREMFRDFTLWKTIKCVELEEINPSICGCVDICQFIRRSTVDIPESFVSNYGLLLKVLTVDGRKEFKHIKSFDYKDQLNREYKPVDSLVFWIEDKRIYIPDTDIEAVKVLIIPKDAAAVDRLNCDLNACASPLDGVVSYPEYLITLAQQEVLKELAGRTGLPEDEKGDDNTHKKV